MVHLGAILAVVIGSLPAEWCPTSFALTGAEPPHLEGPLARPSGPVGTHRRPGASVRRGKFARDGCPAAVQDDAVSETARSLPTVARPSPGLQSLVAAGFVDAQLGALLWALLEGGVPSLVVGPVGDESVTTVADALESVVVTDEHGGSGRSVRTLRAGSLQEAFDILGADPFHLTDDAIRSLGIVIVARDGRVAAAHYLRPVERDREGHLQRRPPAVLATWEESANRFEHFAWAVTPELAIRVGRTQAELEDEISERARRLAVA